MQNLFNFVTINNWLVPEEVCHATYIVTLTIRPTFYFTYKPTKFFLHREFRIMKKILFTSIALFLAIGLSYSNTQAATFSFLEPAGWNIGDSESTYQEWTATPASPLLASNTPPDSSSATPSISNTSTLSVDSPGFVAGSGGYYAFSGTYGLFSDNYNHGGTSGTGSYGATYGTHVIVQTAAAPNGVSVIPGTLEIVDIAGSPISGGDNASSLQQSEFFYDTATIPGFGDVDLQGLIFEFWLPGYTGDFKAQWSEQVHSSFQGLRVDSMISEASGGNSPFVLTTSPVPEPGSLILLAVSGLGLGVVAWKRRAKNVL